MEERLIGLALEKLAADVSRSERIILKVLCLRNSIKVCFNLG